MSIVVRPPEPSAARAILWAADRYRSSSSGEIERTAALLSKPFGSVSSTGSIDRASHVEGQQVADGVGVFGSIQPVHDGPAGIGKGRGCLIESTFERTELLDCRPIRPRGAGWRHLPGPKLEHDLLQRLGARCHVVERHLLEREPTGHAVVVAGYTVPIEEFALQS
jgi:hypothetical protein